MNVMDSITILTGDFRELSKQLADDSVDLIFTDPPYTREYLPLYEDLAKVAVRVLKPGGYLFAYGCSEHLPTILAFLLVDGLVHFQTEILLHTNGTPRLWYKRLMCGYKPILVYTKGKPALLPWRATVHKDKKDKRFHKWGEGKGTAIRIIEMLTRPGDLVLDPFIGGGTTAVACLQTGRRCIGYEIDPKVANNARRRLAGSQLSLFSPQMLEVLRPPEPEHLKVNCQYCGSEFEPKRSDARFCKNSCRQAAYRKRRLLHLSVTG